MNALEIINRVNEVARKIRCIPTADSPDVSGKHIRERVACECESLAKDIQDEILGSCKLSKGKL